MFSIDIREYSINGGFREIGHIVGRVRVSLPFLNVARGFRRGKLDDDMFGVMWFCRLSTI